MIALPKENLLMDPLEGLLEMTNHHLTHSTCAAGAWMSAQARGSVACLPFPQTNVCGSHAVSMTKTPTNKTKPEKSYIAHIGSS